MRNAAEMLRMIPHKTIKVGSLAWPGARLGAGGHNAVSMVPWACVPGRLRQRALEYHHAVFHWILGAPHKNKTCRQQLGGLGLEYLSPSMQAESYHNGNVLPYGLHIRGAAGGRSVNRSDAYRGRGGDWR